MSTYIGRNRDDLLNITKASDGVTDATATTSERASTIAEERAHKIQAEMNELRIFFTGASDALDGQITKFTTTVSTSNWRGQAKNQADVTANELRTELTQVRTRTDGMLENLGVYLRTSTEAVSTRLADVLREHGARYSELGQVVAKFDAASELAESTTKSRLA